MVVQCPKPTTVLHSRKVRIYRAASDPFTTHEVLAAMQGTPLRGKRVVVQRYGEPNRELQAALESEGADIIEIVTYRWSLPEDTAPLRRLIGALGRDEIDLGAFTSARQASNLFTVAQNDSKEGLLEQSLAEHSSLQSARSAASRSGSLLCGSISKQNRQSSGRLSRQSTRHCPTGVRWANHNAGRFGAKPQLALSRITGNAIRNWYN